MLSGHSPRGFGTSHWRHYEAIAQTQAAEAHRIK
jgi:hypothetical protein